VDVVAFDQHVGDLGAEALLLSVGVNTEGRGELVVEELDVAAGAEQLGAAGELQSPEAQVARVVDHGVVELGRRARRGTDGDHARVAEAGDVRVEGAGLEADHIATRGRGERSGQIFTVGQCLAAAHFFFFFFFFGFAWGLDRRDRRAAGLGIDRRSQNRHARPIERIGAGDHLGAVAESVAVGVEPERARPDPVQLGRVGQPVAVTVGAGWKVRQRDDPRCADARQRSRWSRGWKCAHRQEGEQKPAEAHGAILACAFTAPGTIYGR
jgi:hypothetical protein